MRTYPAVQILEPGGVLVAHREVLVQDLAGLLDLELLHPKEAEDEGGVQPHPPDVVLRLDPFPDLGQGSLPHLGLFL